MKKVFSAYDDVWVVVYRGMYDVDEIYLDKAKAEEAARISNEEYSKMNRTMLPVFDMERNKYVVKSLYDAIEAIKESVRDSAREAEYYDEI